MQLFATFVKNKCSFLNFLVQQNLALVITTRFSLNIFSLAPAPPSQLFFSIKCRQNRLLRVMFIEL